MQRLYRITLQVTQCERGMTSYMLSCRDLYASGITVALAEATTMLLKQRDYTSEIIAIERL